MAIFCFYAFLLFVDNSSENNFIKNFVPLYTEKISDSGQSLLNQGEFLEIGSDLKSINNLKLKVL